MNNLSLSRRDFLAAAGAAPFVASAAFAQSKKIPIGIELYSVRGELQKDMPGTVRAVAKMGYQVVEFYSPYYDWTTDQAKDVRKLLDDLGIKCLSTHNSAQAISADGMAKAMELNQIIGSKYIIVASAGKISGADGWKAFADQMAGAAEKLRAHNMATGFHNHQVEWKPLRGRRAADGHPRRRTRRRTSSCSSMPAPPSRSAADAVAWIKANPGRIKSIHLKDWGKGEGRLHRRLRRRERAVEAAVPGGGISRRRRVLPDRAGTCRARRRDRDGAAVPE